MEDDFEREYAEELQMTQKDSMNNSIVHVASWITYLHTSTTCGKMIYYINIWISLDFGGEDMPVSHSELILERPTLSSEPGISRKRQIEESPTFPLLPCDHADTPRKKLVLQIKPKNIILYVLCLATDL